MAIKKGLGKGLDALLGDFTAQSDDGVKEIDIYKVDTNTDQPRKTFDEEKLREMAESIKRHGIIQPIIVKQNGDRYTIVAGERRYRAARIAQLSTVPVIVREFNSAQVMEIALIENIQRENLNPIEEAAAIKFLMHEHDLTQEEVASRLSKSRSAIANSLRLLTLDENVQDFLREGKMQAGHARALAALKDSDEQKRLADQIVENGLSARDAEALAKKANTAKVPKEKKLKAKKMDDCNELRDAENTLREHLGTKVNIVGDSSRGRLVIDYYSKDDLQGLYDLLTR